MVDTTAVGAYTARHQAAYSTTAVTTADPTTDGRAKEIGGSLVDPASRTIIAALRVRGLDEETLSAVVENATKSGRDVRSVLLDDQVVTDIELAMAVAEAWGLEAVELGSYPIDPGAMAKVPLSLARRHNMLPIAIDDTTVTVALENPSDILGLDDIRAATGMSVKAVVATKDDLTRLMARYTRASTDLDEAAAQAEAEDSSEMSEMATADEDAPVVRYVNGLLERAITSRASDIHLEPGEFDLKVRLRIDGVLHSIDTVPRGIQSALISRLKIMSGLDITERRVPQNGRITKSLGERSIDLRSATLPTVWGEKVVLRVLDTGGIDLNLRKLGFTDYNYERFSRSFSKPHGMVLVTGPTGSGKSTTLYATLGEIARPEVNVITVEDPVEYRMEGINQVQVNFKAGLTFAAVLPAILRSDPDIVLIGEIRDRATAQLAVEAALTGHLVLSTLHTNDAPSAMPRLIEMGIEPFLVGSSLDAVLAQRLSRRLCEWCKEPYAPTESELMGAGWPTSGEAPEKLWKAVGCRSCAQTGYRGRLAVNEVMPVTEEIERMAVKHASASEIKKVAVEGGMVALREDGLLKAAEGLTTLEEIIRVTV
ncbi:Flp pilus assembly complex ATPase component TadA [Jatrophihabitans telluris]|uniref:Flp pilus assembly complex ATPase component TadA n=1 Tax=Jatrophihabitans telluris TaxID=2038343 RepID=A0ABY4R201_9ACTN|nr:ATPase, T2SS/T4P/T4SS family [Jatrophihabitans telluris]UQX89552.1 Flp pilus assembly complex ATPase component TadA [Jatrophihabitans telluris]